MPPVGVSVPFPPSVIGEDQGVKTTKVRYEALVGGRQLVFCAAVVGATLLLRVYA